MATAAPATRRWRFIAAKPIATSTRRWASTKAGAPAPTSSASSPRGWRPPPERHSRRGRRNAMRKIIVSTFVSLDGVMHAPGGPEEDRSGGFAFGGWVFPHWDEATREAIDALFAAPFDLLLGRKTYEIFAAYWPFIEGDPIAERFNAVTKFVVTSSAEPLAWHGSVAVRGDVPAEIARLKQQDGPNLLVQGSSVLVQSLLA